MIYELAGLRVNVKNRCRYTSEFCKEYLSEDQDSSADFEAETTKEEFYAEKEASPGFSDGYIENICLYRKICLQMPEYDRFLLHSAVEQQTRSGVFRPPRRQTDCFRRFYCPRNGARRKKRWNLPTVSLRTCPRTYCVAIWKRKRRKRRFPL